MRQCVPGPGSGTSTGLTITTPDPSPAGEQLGERLELGSAVVGTLEGTELGLGDKDGEVDGDRDGVVDGDELGRIETVGAILGMIDGS